MNRLTSYKNIVYILLSIILGTSCNDEQFFELQRAPEFPWQSVAEYEKAALGAYSATIVRSNFGNVPGTDIMNDFVLSENARFVLGSAANFPYLEINGRSFSSTNTKVDVPFQGCYQTIGACNSALEFYEKNNGKPFPNAKESDQINNVNRIAGELYFMRAYSYFYLVRQYHPPYDPQGKNDFIGLPYRSKLSGSMDEVLNPDFYTTAQFYAAIVADLKKAKELLPAKYNSTTMHPSYQYGRANKFVASAMLARVYLLMGKHTGAESAENEYNFIVENGGYKLENDIFNNFNRSINNFKNNNSEILWEFFSSQTQGLLRFPWELSHFTKSNANRTDNDRRKPLFTDPKVSSSAGRGNNWSFGPWSQYSMSHPVLINKLKWMNADGSLTDIAKKDKRFQKLYCYMREFKQNVNKAIGEDTLYLSDPFYIGENMPTIWIDKAYRGFEGRRTNFPLIRFAEILIHRAAIRFEKGDKKGAADDVNLIRKRAWGNTTIPYETSPDFLTESNITFETIENEHIKELSAEGSWLIFQIAFRRPIDQPDLPQPPATINPPYTEMRWAIPSKELIFYQK